MRLTRGDAIAADWHDRSMVLSRTESPTVHRLPATPSTVHWGYFDPRLEPVLTVASGDLVAIETPAKAERVSSVPPGDHGGNVDNWRIGAGGRMYYPIHVPGALLSVGDPHVSQGDGEISGTALESSLNGLLRLTIRRDLPFSVPILEAATELLVHGFGDTLDDAMKAAALRTHNILESYFGLSRADAYSFMSVAVDFSVTQVVDQRQGIHGRIDKRCFPRWVGVPA
jgi:acetamidase/formamidase